MRTHRLRHIVAAVLAVAALGGVAMLRAQAGASPAVDRALLVLLDVSGSMRESVRGGVKHELAVRGLLQTLRTLPAQSIAGLRLIGEGTGSDECGATRTAVELKPFDLEEWNTALSRVQWRGATPVVYSMRAALEDLRRVNAARRGLLIIGDGDETCGQDPVGAARAEAGGIRIDTISLGEEVSHQLAGIALVTGGSYTRAFDETTFAAAVGRSVPAPAVTSAAATPSVARPRLEIILDVSNSMIGRVGGRTKIELAREALTRALADVPADLPIGLRAYGHRVPVADRDAGCTDTERLVRPEPGKAAEIVSLANRLAPRGHTPIARSLREAGADLAAEGGAGVILLLTDGVESCGGDPSAAAAELRASGLQVVLHTVGLGVTGSEAAALADMARAGGGLYFNAPTAADLTRGVGAAVQSGREFVLRQDAAATFPSEIRRVRGGATVAEAEPIEPGHYSFADHLFREQRYFAVRGRPGTTVTLRGLVAALEIGRTRAGVVTYQRAPNMMFAERVDTAGLRLRGDSLTVRGNMGTWVEMPIQMGSDGVARFRIGRPLGAVHRDMVFSIAR